MEQIPKTMLDNEAANRAQDISNNKINQLSSLPFAAGVEITTSLGSGNTTISHRLNRPYQGYFIMSQTAAASIYNNQGSSDRRLFLVLNSSAPVTVKLWVF